MTFAGEAPGDSVANSVGVGATDADSAGAALAAADALGVGDGGNGARLATALGAVVDALPPIQAALISATAMTAREVSRRGR